MRLADTKTLLEYARLQLEITKARNPTAEINCSPKNVHRTIGYKKLRAFTAQLTPKKRAQFIKQLRGEIVGVREVMALAAKTGEPLSLADITIEVLDDKGAKLEAPKLALDGEPDDSPAP